MSTRGWIASDVAIAHLQGLNCVDGSRGWILARELAAHLGADTRATGQRLKALERRGLVEKVYLERRYKTVASRPVTRHHGWKITAAGEAVLRAGAIVPPAP